MNEFGRVIGVKNNVAKFLDGSALNVELCVWSGAGGYDGLVIVRVHADGSRKPYGQARSKSHVQKIWNSFRAN